MFHAFRVYFQGGCPDEGFVLTSVQCRHISKTEMNIMRNAITMKTRPRVAAECQLAFSTEVRSRMVRSSMLEEDAALIEKYCKLLQRVQKCIQF
jgi:hypothetical protein